MTNIIQFPRPLPERKWSPSEILALKEPPDSSAIYRQERARIASTKAIAASAAERERKKAKRKKAIADILSGGRQWWTVTVLMRLVKAGTGEPISRTTVTALLKELEEEGTAIAVNNVYGHQFWKSTSK